jgi:hypothetical protein
MNIRHPFASDCPIEPPTSAIKSRSECLNVTEHIRASVQQHLYFAHRPLTTTVPALMLKFRFSSLPTTLESSCNFTADEASDFRLEQLAIAAHGQRDAWQLLFQLQYNHMSAVLYAARVRQLSKRCCTTLWRHLAGYRILFFFLRCVPRSLLLDRPLVAETESVPSQHTLSCVFATSAPDPTVLRVCFLRMGITGLCLS